jgi:hypothetical protein
MCRLQMRPSREIGQFRTDYNAPHLAARNSFGSFAMLAAIAPPSRVSSLARISKDIWSLEM